MRNLTLFVILAVQASGCESPPSDVDWFIVESLYGPLLDEERSQTSSATCQYTIQGEGLARVVGSRVQFVYDDSKLGVDTLILQGDSLTGRNNNFGIIVILSRLP